MSQGISQMIRNQGNDYAPHLFKFIQIVMATNKNETKYATCKTPKRFWSVWQEEDQDWLQYWLDKSVEGRLSTMQRSEEHTSELQSRGHIVCCLLHETKNH